ncbi:MAG: ribonuclease Z [Myxococcota bacterium]
MHLTFLGTGGGMPTRERNVSALALSLGSRWFLFDCGEGTQHRLMHTALSLGKLSRVFISHLHGDHVYGLFGLLGTRSMLGLSQTLDIYGPTGIEEMVRTVMGLSAMHSKSPLIFHELGEDGGSVLDTERLCIEAYPLDHRVPCLAWHIKERESQGALDMDKVRDLGVPVGPALGQLKRGETVVLANGSSVSPFQVLGPTARGRSVIIAGDNRDPESLLARSGPVDVLVHEATFTEEVLARLPDDKGHSTAARVGHAAQGRVKNLVLTHFSARYQRSDGSIEQVSDEAQKHFTGTLILADDLARFQLSRDGALRQEPN